MIQAINKAEYRPSFLNKPEKNKGHEGTHLVPNNAKTRLEQGSQRVMSAFIDYPVKGLMGDINTNFYEFLTMGIVPYIAGSAMFMLVFNITKHLDAKGYKTAGNFGRKMALGVLLYGVLKGLSKSLVTKPVKSFTGVDTEMPYQNIVYNLPKGADDKARMDIRWQQRKVFDSKEFYRKDLLDKSYFDNVAKKLGLGENLNDSVSEVSPIIQNIVATSNTAKSLSSYCWAAVGVGMATQDAWSDFFNTIINKNKYTAKEGETFFSKLGGKTKASGKNIYKGTIAFFKSLVNSFKQLWLGKEGRTGFMKHAGKSLILTAAAITSILTANTIIKAKNMVKNSNINTIDKNKESTVI